MTLQADSGTVDADNPWPGLAAFREADRDLFYGREAETQELLRLALRERLTVLFGLSGLGKTSLLRAGLFPLLRQENVLPVYIRLDFSDEGIRRTLAGQVRQAIASEAAAAGIEAPAFSESETLWESLHRQGAEFWSPRNRIVTPLLVFDQFEEVFTLGRGNADRAQEAEAFLTELADLCEGGVPASLRARLEADPDAARGLSFTRHPYKILLSLREDFLPELEGLRGRIRSIVHNRYRLRRMNGGNALRVVTEAGGRLVEPDVPEKIVRFVAGRKSDEIPWVELEVEPALLSVVCRELNNKRRAQGLPRITADLVQGNRDEILSDLYERSVGDLGPGVRSFIEERLLTKSGFRDSVARENVIECSQEALDKLTDRRLLRIEDRGGMQRIELTHDVLTGVIRKSRDQRREREAVRKLRRSRLVIALLGLVLIGVLALAAWAFTAQRRANERLASSDVERAWNLQESTPAHALAHLARAIRTEPESLAAQTLLSDLLLDRTWLRPVQTFRNPEEKVIYLSEDGRRFVTSGKRGLQVRDTRTLQSIGRPIVLQARRASLAVRLGGERLLTHSWNPDASQLWDLRTGQEIPLPAQMGTGLLLSPDGLWIVGGPPYGAITLLEIDTGETHEIRSLSSSPTFAFSPDGRKLFVDDRQTLFVWDVPTRRLSSVKAPEGFMRAALSPDGERVVIAAYKAMNWEITTGATFELSLLTGELFNAWAILLSPDNERMLVVPDSTDEVRVWNLREPSLKPLRIAAGVEFSRIELSRDGQLFLAMARDRIVLLNVYGGKRVAEVLCDCFSAHFIAGTQQIALLDGSDALQIWSFAAPQAGMEFLSPSSFGDTLTPMFSEDGSRLAFQTDRSEIRVVDTDSTHFVGRPFQLPDPVTRPWLSPDGSFLAVLVEGGSKISVLDTRNGGLAWSPQQFPKELLQTLIASNRSAIGPGGKVLAIAVEKESGWIIDLWELETGKRLRPLEVGSRIWSLAFSKDGERIATATEDGAARIWDLRSGALLGGPLAHPALAEARFEQGDRRLLTWSAQLAQIWDIRTGRPAGPPIRFEKPIQLARLSQDGLRLVAQQQLEGGSLLLFDARTGRQLRNPVDMDSSQALLSPQGQLLWGISNRSIHVLAVPTFPARDADLLARWAEAAGGYRLDAQSRLTALPDQGAQLAALRRETADAPQDQLTAASLIRWFLADPATRGLSPVVHRTVSEYLRYDLEQRTSFAWDRAAAAFPGHPLLQRFPRPATPPDLP